MPFLETAMLAYVTSRPPRLTLTGRDQVRPSSSLWLRTMLKTPIRDTRDQAT